MKFESLTFNQLISAVDARFYSRVRTRSDLVDFLNALYRSSCWHNGVRSEIKPLEFPLLKPADYSLFYPSVMSSGLNKRLVDMFDFCRITKNTYYPYLLVASVLHESRHHAQSVANSKVAGYLKQIARLKISAPVIAQSISYNTSPIEVDARNYSFQTLKQNQFATAYQSHRDFYQRERHAARADISSILLAATLLQQALRTCARPNENDIQFAKNLKKSCDSFLSRQGVNPVKFDKAILNYNTKMDIFLRCTRRPKEFAILSEEKERLSKELSKKVFQEIALSEDDLQYCEDRLSMLKIRQEAKDYAYCQLKLDAYKLLESRLLYREFGHDFMQFDNLYKSAPPAPQEEVDFFKVYKGEKQAATE